MKLWMYQILFSIKLIIKNNNILVEE
jgi:hypothetical protein